MYAKQDWMHTFSMHTLQGDGCSRSPFLHINIYLSAACWNYKPMWYTTPLQGREWQNILMQATGGGKQTFNHPCALQSWRREMMFSFFKISIICSVPNICNCLLEAFRTTVCCIAFLQKVRMVLKGFKEFSTELSWEPPTYPFCKIKTSFWKKRGKNKTYEERKEKGNDKK